jgi:hypothetical protein
VSAADRSAAHSTTRMQLRYVVKLGVLTFMGSISSASAAWTVRHFSSPAASCSKGKYCDSRASDAEPGTAMLQQRFEKVAAREIPGESHIDGIQLLTQKPQGSTSNSKAKRSSAESKPYRWGEKLDDNPETDHPRSLGKSDPHPQVQQYQARLPYLSSMVLNMFVKKSDGKGGLMIALEVPAMCGTSDLWVEVDRARCSSRYPCALRLPPSAVRLNETEPTAFRTRVILEYDDYDTTFLEYGRVTLDHDAEVTVAHESYSQPLVKTSHLRFRLSAAMSAGALYVTPIVKGASAKSEVTMRFRQPQSSPEGQFHEERERKSSIFANNTRHWLNTKQWVGMADATLQTSDKTLETSDTEMNMKVLDATLQSYRLPWAGQWRSPSQNIGCCDLSFFEVVADQIFSGEVELEVLVTGDDEAYISDVLVTTRVSWAEAEVSLLDGILKDHFTLFNDPENIVHGLPMGALKKEDPKALVISNPTEWGYAMESWVVMAETGFLQPDEAVAKLNGSLATVKKLQDDPDQFAHGMFYPYYRMRDEDGDKQFPQRTEAEELPCGDDALFFASLMMVQGWLKSNSFHHEADACATILRQMDFSRCIRQTHCTENEADGELQGDRFWSVALTFNAKTLEPSPYNWNVWADEGGIVAMVVALSGGMNYTQYESIVRQQQRYSPCSHWKGITVKHSAFFNSIFTLPTRSMLGFGTLFASPYYHEFAVRSLLPSFRAHQKLKKKIGADYMGPSDAMSQQAAPGKFFGSYAYWPPNNMYDCSKGKTTLQNQCTWCEGIQYEGLDDPFSMIVPHGNMVSFLASAMMERSQFTEWLEDTKLLMTDASEVYAPGYGLEVVAPAKRTPLEGQFEGALDGRGIWESLSYGYTVLSMYEGLATMRRRYEMVKQEGIEVPSSYEPPKYKPLSDFVSALPEVRSKINRLLDIAREQESTEKKCPPSEYGPGSR